MEAQTQEESANAGGQERPHPESKYWNLEMRAVPSRDKMTIVRWAESEMNRGIPRAVIVEQLLRSAGARAQAAANTPPVQAAEHVRRHGVQAFQDALSYAKGHRKDIALRELQALVNAGDLTGDAFDAMREIYEELGEYDKAAQACRDYMALVDVVLAKGWIRNTANVQTLRGKRQQFEREIRQMERRSRRTRAQARNES
jgi:hypothetical protein